MGNLGSVITSGMKKTMEETMRKQQETMVENQRIMMERQMTMQQLLIQRQMAMGVARAREMFTWMAAFAATLSTGALAAAARTKNPKLLAPLVPLSFVVGYQYDMSYGNKMDRIRADAERMIKEHDSILLLPTGPVTLAEVEEKRKRM